MDNAQNTLNIPPKGDFKKAEQYTNKLISLIEQNKLLVYHTDLKKYDPNTLQDHYRLDLKEYQIELSHSKQAESGNDSYVLIFTNIKNIQAGSCDKVILAYSALSPIQFSQFKKAAEGQIADRIRAAELKRFSEALAPIDSLLEEAESSTQVAEKAETDQPKTDENPKKDWSLNDNQTTEEKPSSEERSHHLTSYPVHQA